VGQDPHMYHTLLKKGL